MKKNIRVITMIILICSLFLGFSYKNNGFTSTYKDLNLTEAEKVAVENQRGKTVNVAIADFYNYKQYESLIKNTFEKFFNVKLNLIEYKTYDDAYRDMKDKKVKYIITNYRHNNDLIKSDVVYSGDFYAAYKPNENKNYNDEARDYSFFRNKTTYIREGCPLIYSIKNDSKKSKVVEYKDIDKAIDEISKKDNNSVLLINAHMLEKVYQKGLVTSNVLNEYKSPIMLIESREENKVLLGLINKFLNEGGKVYLGENINYGLINNSKDVFLNYILTKEEREWLEKNKKITLNVLSESYPIVFSENGETKGIAKDYLESLSKLTGLDINYNYIKDKSINDVSNISSDEVYLDYSLYDFKNTLNYEINSKIFLLGSTDSNMEEEYIEDSSRSIGVLRGSYVTEYFKSIGKSNVKVFNSIEELFNSYDKEKINLIAINEYIYYNEMLTGKHNMTVLKKLQVDAGGKLFYFSNDKILYSIFNKAIDRLVNDEAIQSKWENTVDREINNSFYEHNKELKESAIIKAVGIAISIVAIILLVLSVIYRKQNNELTRNKMLVEIIEENNDDIFFIYNFKSENFIYISNNIDRILKGLTREMVTEDALAPTRFFDKEYEDILSRAFKEKKNSLKVVVTATEGENKKLFYEVNFFPITTKKYNDTYNVEDIICVKVTNITREYEDNINLQRAFKKVKDADKAKSIFLANISHEIRTPINAIMGTSSVGLEHTSGVKEKEYFERIFASSEYLSKLINDILDIAKAGSGTFKIEDGKINLKNIIDEVEFIVSDKVKERNQSLIINFDNKLNNIYTGDSKRLTQVILNLLSNAIKFTFENKQITLSVVEVSGDSAKSIIKISVIDQGIGIPKEAVKHLFDPFYQLYNKSKGKQLGTGLGLAISKQIIDLMNGSLEVETEEDKGSKFSFTITLEKESLPNENSIVNEQKPTKESIEGMKILLVDDVEINRILVEEMLSDKNVEIHTAENGKEGLEKFLRSDIGYYDVILMDIQMPIMNGNEAVEAIRKSSREDALTVRIVAMSANAFDEDIEESKKAGVDEYITKPIDTDKLINVLLG